MSFCVQLLGFVWPGEPVGQRSFARTLVRERAHRPGEVSGRSAGERASAEAADG